jgi:DivIVA domain-containing protein
MMEWFIALVAVIVIGLAAIAASGRFGQLTAAQTDRPEPQWPDGPLQSADIDDLGFAVVPRGYAMDQVDEFCERVKARLEEMEAEGRNDAVVGFDNDAEPRNEAYDDDGDEPGPTAMSRPPSYAGSVVSPLRAKAPTPRRLSAWR